MPLTRFGFQIPSFTYEGVPDGELFSAVVAAATGAEQNGFDSLWVMDHMHQIPPIGAPDEPMLEPYTLLAAIAAVTDTARLGTLVTGVTYRNPALLAKTVTTLDIVSAGRAILGIGAAWYEAEHLAYGYDFPSVSDRMDRLEDALRICRSMFTDEQATVSGHHHRVEAALNRPSPVTPGGPPILVGGGGEKRTLRLAAQYADACNIVGDPETVRHKLDVLAAHCADFDRDPAEITNTRLGAIVMADTASAAARLGEELRVRRNMDMAKYTNYAIEGDRDRVAEQIQALIHSGIDGFIFNVHDATDLEAIATAGAFLRDTFGDR